MYAFIGGPPTAGKSYLAKKFSHDSELVIQDINLDNIRLRDEFRQNRHLLHWEQFFWKQEERKYWQTTSYGEHIQNLINQSKAFWSEILREVSGAQKKYPHAIFQGVNILPHLAAKYLDFPGFYLIPKNPGVIYKRLKQSPRWGKTEELLKLEAKYYFEYEGRFFQESAPKYGFPVFNNYQQAEEELFKIFQPALKQL